MERGEYLAKLKEPQTAPGADENEVSDYFRVVWLVRNYLKRQTYVDVAAASQRVRPEEYLVEFYQDPDARLWRLGYLSAGGMTLSRVLPG